MAKTNQWEASVKIKVTSSRGVKMSQDLLEYLIRKDLGSGSETDEAYVVLYVEVVTLENMDSERLPF